MSTRLCFLFLCFAACSESSVIPLGYGMELLQTQLENLQQQMENLEQNVRMERKILAMEENLQEKLQSLENKLNQITPYNSCKEVSSKVSGKYEIQFVSQKTRLPVYCEQNAFGGGWTVFQHRFNGKENFFRSWADYRNGFGNLDGEFWLGLENLHQLTSEGPHELMVEMRDYHGNYGYAHYDQVTIASESEQYRLKLGKYYGTAGDSMRANSNQKFSTWDSDNDGDQNNCAVSQYGAWWYEKGCSFNNLNGVYQNVTHAWVAMTWSVFKDDYRGMAYTRMMVREIN